MDKRIRLASTTSVNSIDEKTLVNVDIKRHTKSFPFPSLSYTIDQMEQFEMERADSTKYRLILTINPYCTNILFNAVTEIVQNEGTDDKNALKIASSNKGINNLNVGGYTIKGKKTDVTNIDMVRNTEYSNGDKPFVYHCGYDIFNNHILRNQTFKLVNTISTNSNIYNTIEDFMRYADGSPVKYSKRLSIKTIPPQTPTDNMHLYLKDDVLDFIDSINTNLSEENGWWGFNNRATIPSCEYNEEEWRDLNISKVFNNEQMGCGFVEMYPDSTLYSFNPKYNKFQNREEHNWDICITYPYENDEENILVCGMLQNNEKLFNGLLLASYSQILGTSGQPILMFRSYVKHNLNIGDDIKLYYSTSQDAKNGYKEIEERLFRVVNVGNMDGEYRDYYFYINDVEEILEEVGDIDEIGNDYTFRFVKVINNRNCKYYYRKFKKLPNLKFKREELTDEITQNKEEFENYITNNARVVVTDNNSPMLSFSKEQYPLGFSKTIYNDDVTQVVFTDTLDVDKLLDNLGRPLTQLFITIIKRNKGHELWYKQNKTADDMKKIEFSHCFGEVVSGIDVHGEWTDDNTENFLLDLRLNVGDVTQLNVENKDNYAISKDVKIDDDEFYGDVVELDCYNMSETILSDVYFRFNTEQREHIFDEENELNCGTFVYDEIISDDYDLHGFKCEHYDMDCVNTNGEPKDEEDDCEYKPNKSNNYKRTTYRLEGYYYKAHYPIQIRDFGVMKQGSHKEIIVSECRPRQANGMFIEVLTALRYSISAGDIIYLCDDKEDISIPLFVNDVLSNIRFLISPMIPNDDENYKSVFDIVDGLLHSDGKIITEDDVESVYHWEDKDGISRTAHTEDIGTEVFDYSKPKYILRVKNNEIPFYAYKVDSNLYIWRDLLTVGNKDAVNLDEYPFANGHFYINKAINFYLKRQDAFGNNNLYSEDLIPNDISGNIKKGNNYEYNDGTHSVC